MKSTLILTVIGRDHPGIIDELSSVIIDNGGNWLESRMCNLAGQFAGVLLVECPLDKHESLHTALDNLENNGLKIQVATGSDVGDMDSGGDQFKQVHIELEITGPDHPGIVHDISHFLAGRNVNIVEMESHCEEGAMSGGYVFHSKITANIPDLQELGDVEDALDDLAGELNVDITLDDLKGKRTRI
jgi:glycine cleavage system regulatory protein